MISGKAAPVPGEAKNSWLTGTASWSFLAFTQYILGIRPGFDGLVIDPCPPSSWEGYTVERVYRGSRYIISVQKTGNPREGTSVRIDGTPVTGNTIVAFQDGRTHHVDVLLG